MEMKKIAPRGSHPWCLQLDEPMVCAAASAYFQILMSEIDLDIIDLDLVISFYRLLRVNLNLMLDLLT